MLGLQCVWWKYKKIHNKQLPVCHCWTTKLFSSFFSNMKIGSTAFPKSSYYVYITGCGTLFEQIWRLFTALTSIGWPFYSCYSHFLQHVALKKRAGDIFYKLYLENDLLKIFFPHHSCLREILVYPQRGRLMGVLRPVWFLDTCATEGKWRRYI